MTLSTIIYHRNIDKLNGRLTEISKTHSLRDPTKYEWTHENIAIQAQRMTEIVTNGSKFGHSRKTKQGRLH